MLIRELTESAHPLEAQLGATPNRGPRVETESGPAGSFGHSLLPSSAGIGRAGYAREHRRPGAGRGCPGETPTRVPARAGHRLESAAQRQRTARPAARVVLASAAGR